MLGIDLGAYSQMLGLAVLVAFGFSITMAVATGLPTIRSLAVLIISSAFGFVGARLVYWLTHLDADRGFQLWTWAPVGFSLYGGLLTASLSGAVASWLVRVDPWKMADAVSPSLGLGIAIVRWGCWSRGCCFGLPTNLPWGYRPDTQSPAWIQQSIQNPLAALQEIQPIHPTQIYELLAGLSAGTVALVLIRFRLPAGVAASITAAFFTLLRLGILPCRDYRGDGETERWTMLLLYPPLILSLLTIAWIRSRVAGSDKSGQGSVSNKKWGRQH